MTLALVFAGTVSAGEREDWYLAALDHMDSGLGVLLLTVDDGSRWIRVSDLRLLELPVPAAPTRLHAGETYVPLSSLALAADIDAVGRRLHLFDPHARAVATPEDLVVDITVNGLGLPEPQIIRRQGRDLLLSPQTLALAHLAPAAGDADWVPVRSFAGDHYVLDERRMRLEITADPGHFASTRLRLGGPDVAPLARARAPLSAIVGYDIGVGQAPEGERRGSLLLDGALSGGRLGCRNRAVWRTGFSWSRLDSTCFVDWPQRRLSLAVGDGISRDSSLSPAVRYGGVRIGTDFDLQPHLRTQPLLGVEGTARLPSVLEIWSRQQLAFRGELPPGPFMVDGIPSQTGRGLLEAVVIDALGRQVLVSAPFYSDPDLLRPGLTDWSLESGRLREGFLSPGDRYGDRFALFSWRRGLAPYWTLEARVEWQASHHLYGVANHLRLGHSGVAEISAARSGGGRVRGDAWALGYTFQGERWALGLRYAGYDRDYRDLAYPVEGTAPARDARANAGLRIGRASLSIGAVVRDSRAAGEQRLARAALNVPLGRGFLNLTAFRPLQDASGTLYGAIFTLPLSHHRSASAWLSADSEGIDPGVTLQRSLPVGPGYGYRVSHEDSALGARTTMEGRLRTDAAQWSAAALRTGTGTDVRIGATGALVATGQGVFPATDDGGSFALVDLPQADGRVLREHQFAASTRANGKALVSGLRPFESNRLDLDSTSLALSTRIRDTRLELVPGRRQVVLADFGASRMVPVTLRVTTRDGTPVAAGALARWSDRASTQVGYDGLMYVELEDGAHPIEITWSGQRCTIPAAALPTAPDPSLIYEATCQ